MDLFHQISCLLSVGTGSVVFLVLRVLVGLVFLVVDSPVVDSLVGREVVVDLVGLVRFSVVVPIK